MYIPYMSPHLMQQEYYCVVHFSQRLSHTLHSGIVCPNLPNPGNGGVVPQAHGGNVPGTVATTPAMQATDCRGMRSGHVAVLHGVWSGVAPTCQSKALK